MRVKVNEYEVVLEPTGRLHALRYGDEWRDCVGDQLVLLMAMEIERLREREQVLVKGCAKQNEEVCQILGRALGYPAFKDDQANFPGATDADGVCVGDHVAESIAEEAARRIRELTEQVSEKQGVIDRMRDRMFDLQADIGSLNPEPDGTELSHLEDQLLVMTVWIRPDVMACKPEPLTSAERNCARYDTIARRLVAMLKERANDCA